MSLLGPNERAGDVMGQHSAPSQAVFDGIERRNTVPQGRSSVFRWHLYKLFSFLMLETTKLFIYALRSLVFLAIDLSLMMFVKNLIDGLPDMTLIINERVALFWGLFVERGQKFSLLN